MEENENKNEFKEKVEDVKADVKEAYEKASEKAQKTVDQIKAEIDDFTAEMDPEDVQKNKIMAVLAYIGILVLIPIFLAKDSKFARFHANQGLVLFLISIVCGALAKIKFIGWIAGLVGIVVFVLAVVGIVYAVQGKAKELPVVGNWKLLK